MLLCDEVVSVAGGSVSTNRAGYRFRSTTDVQTGDYVQDGGVHYKVLGLVQVGRGFVEALAEGIGSSA